MARPRQPRALGQYGCHHPRKWEFSTFLPIPEKQTSNRAELYAIIKVIDKASGKVVIVTHYVCVQGC